MVLTELCQNMWLKIGLICEVLKHNFYGVRMKRQILPKDVLVEPSLKSNVIYFEYGLLRLWSTSNLMTPYDRT